MRAIIGIIIVSAIILVPLISLCLMVGGGRRDED
jgi:hypothetical protein